jgi:hypothetical protein
LQPTRQFASLVGGDAAGDAEDELLAGEVHGGELIPTLERERGGLPSPGAPRHPLPEGEGSI